MQIFAILCTLSVLIYNQHRQCFRVPAALQGLTKITCDWNKKDNNRRRNRNNQLKIELLSYVVNLFSTSFHFKPLTKWIWMCSWERLILYKFWICQATHHPFTFSSFQGDSKESLAWVQTWKLMKVWHSC